MHPESHSPLNFPTAMTVAGSDSGGGAGIQADLLTFAALEVHGTSAITCLTAQNPAGVSGVFPVGGGFVLEQMLQISDFFPVAAIKTGMLFSEEIIHAVSDFMNDHPTIPVVVDPVMVATSGAILLQPEAVEALRKELFSRATLITPNLDEVRILLGDGIGQESTAVESGLRLRDLYGCSVLIKGGHGKGDRAIDTLVSASGDTIVLDYPRIRNIDTHGSGCTLAAAIAAFLARQEPLEAAVRRARAFLEEAMERPKTIGGRAYIRC